MPTLFTIGHSNKSIEEFLELLTRHEVEVLVDVRSSPYTKYATHFNYGNFKLAVQNAGKKYLYLGKELGGMPKDSDFYDGDGNVMHNKIAETGLFKFGIERLQKGVSLYTVALCCGEENPTGCHRRLLIGRVMSQLGVEVLHIRGDGSLQTEADLEAASGENVKQLRFLD